jgi:redox-sensitive bicupin YhaK (pirin superfamily)
MIAVRKAQDRGHAQHGWLESFHTFSFANYHDPKHMGFRDLRVINEDRVQPGRGFATHSHRDMEIVSVVLDGALEHADSMGNGSVIRPGEVQLMRAGTGVTHSEYNPSDRELVHFLQIWILPRQEGLAPAYAQREFPESERLGRLRVVVSPDGRDGSLHVAQDASLYAGLLREGERVEHALRPGRHAWVQVARGSLRLNGQSLEEGDGAAVRDEAKLELAGTTPSELLVFDLR